MPDPVVEPKIEPTVTPTPDSTPKVEPKTDPKPDASSEPKPSLLNEKDSTAAGAPEKYEDFKAPEGLELDPAVAVEAGKLFKELNLSQDGAQRLVDFYSARTVEAAEAPVKLWKETQDQWVKEIKADKDIGHKLPEVKTTISKAIDTVLGKELGDAFREALDFTGAGNNPAFVKAFYKFSQAFTEGKHVSGGGPSPHGQRRPGAPMDGAHALYPNLP